MATSPWRESNGPIRDLISETLIEWDVKVHHMSHVTLPTTRFSVADFERMVEADVFGTERVELINGRVYRMPAQLDPHMMAIAKTNRALLAVVPQSEVLFVQGTIKLDPFTAVDPDFMWIAAAVGTPEHQRPAPLLVIEVSHTTYKKDGGIKLRKYAQFGIRDYWIENLNEDQIEVYRDPVNPTGKSSGCKFATVRHCKRGESISPLQRPAVSLAVDDLLP